LLENRWQENKYAWFANSAKSGPTKEGWEQIVNIFNETADNEKIHARVFQRYLEGGEVTITATYEAPVIKDTKENLKAAADGEKMECRPFMLICQNSPG